MSTTGPINEVAIDEAQVRKLAEQAIESTCERHGVERNQLKDEAIADAYASARARVLHEKEHSQDVGYQALLQERRKTAALEAQIAALSMSKPVANESGNAGHARSSRLPDSEIVRAKLGPAAWNALTLDGRLTACGIQPSEVTASMREEISEVFGRNANSKRAADLHATRPDHYRKLKSVANILNLTGK
jgi:hypothetical protein